MDFTDTELMMLEQLTYIGGDACDLAGVSAPQNPPETVGERLAAFTPAALKELEWSGEEGQQWAAIIRYIQGNEKMCSLVQGEQFKDDKGRTLATAYYHEPKSSGDALVTFHGTNTPENWYDNGTGLGTSDTDAQKDALAYIDSLPYDDITVVGHSKGGNMSQYVTILSDKVERCVSMDGQGFSQEFHDKYWAQIQENGGKITNYSLSTDFVHILLYPIPNAKQDYCTGDRVDGFAQNHYANSFFSYDTKMTIHGPVTTLELEGGKPKIYNNQPENEMMTYLREFTYFVAATMPQDERVDVGEYVGNILKIGMGKESVNGYSSVMDYVLSDKDMLAKVLAYLIKYVETYNLSEEDLRGLMEVLGMTWLADALDKAYMLHSVVVDKKKDDDESALFFLLKELTDGEKDPVIEGILTVFPGIKEIWRKTEKEYGKIPKIPENANKGKSLHQGKEYHYTFAVYDALMCAYNNFGSMEKANTASWSAYSNRKWYGKLFVGTFLSGINKYNNKLEEIVTAAKHQTERTFDNVAVLDNKYAERLCDQISNVNVLVQALK